MATIQHFTSFGQIYQFLTFCNDIIFMKKSILISKIFTKSKKENKGATKDVPHSTACTCTHTHTQKLSLSKIPKNSW
jgi:hypothetical protein